MSTTRLTNSELRRIEAELNARGYDLDTEGILTDEGRLTGTVIDNGDGTRVIDLGDGYKIFDNGDGTFSVADPGSTDNVDGATVSEMTGESYDGPARVVVDPYAAAIETRATGIPDADFIAGNDNGYVVTGNTQDVIDRINGRNNSSRVIVDPNSNRVIVDPADGDYVSESIGDVVDRIGSRDLGQGGFNPTTSTTATGVVLVDPGFDASWGGGGASDPPGGGGGGASSGGGGGLQTGLTKVDSRGVDFWGPNGDWGGEEIVVGDGDGNPLNDNSPSNWRPSEKTYGVTSEGYRETWVDEHGEIHYPEGHGIVTGVGPNQGTMGAVDSNGNLIDGVRGSDFGVNNNMEKGLRNIGDVGTGGKFPEIPGDVLLVLVADAVDWAIEKYENYQAKLSAEAVGNASGIDPDVDDSDNPGSGDTEGDKDNDAADGGADQIDPNGPLHGEYYGYTFDDDGNIYDADGNLVGNIYDPNGGYSMDSEGGVRDSSGNYIGNIHDDKHDPGDDGTVDGLSGVEPYGDPDDHSGDPTYVGEEFREEKLHLLDAEEEDTELSISDWMQAEFGFDNPNYSLPEGWHYNQNGEIAVNETGDVVGDKDGDGYKDDGPLQGLGQMQNDLDKAINEWLDNDNSVVSPGSVGDETTVSTTVADGGDISKGEDLLDANVLFGDDADEGILIYDNNFGYIDPDQGTWAQLGNGKGVIFAPGGTGGGVDDGGSDLHALDCDCGCHAGEDTPRTWYYHAAGTETTEVERDYSGPYWEGHYEYTFDTESEAYWYLVCDLCGHILDVSESAPIGAVTHT